MLAPLVVNLLIFCITMMLAGWTYDVIGNWTSAHRQVACCTESSVIRLRKRIDRGERSLLSEPDGAGYTQGVKTDQRHQHTRYPA
jgi:hypothetical protein